MTSSGAIVEDEPTEVLYKRPDVLSDSTIDPPMEEWSSLRLSETPVDSPKVAAFRAGEYRPGSGEVCAKYVAMSDSDVLNHVYYAYPSLKDPGVLRALLMPEPQPYYDPNGQELYLVLCEQMKVIPVRCFHRSLVEKEINLKYYCVNPVAVRAMCLAMTLNTYVKRLDLTSNFLSNDACYHLGQLLRVNLVLDELVLAQCKIGPSGVRRVVAHLAPRTMDLLDLSSTGMGDEGFEHVATAIMKGAVIRRLNLSRNDLSTTSAALLADVLEYNNTITHLDLSWNRLYPPAGSGRLLRMLSDSTVLTELNFSWNSLTTGIPLQRILMAPKLRVLDLSNNKLGMAASKAIALRLKNASRLKILDLSYNPFQPADALRILEELRSRQVKVGQLLMADVGVSKEFVATLKIIQELPYRKNTIITYGRVICDYSLSTVDLRLIVMRRLDYLFSRSSKKCHLDISMYIMEQRKARGVNDYMYPQEFLRLMKQNSLAPDEGLILELMNFFPGPKVDKGKPTIGLGGLEEFVHRLWPEKALPPTPPLPPPPPPPPKKNKKTGKKK